MFKGNRELVLKLRVGLLVWLQMPCSVWRTSLVPWDPLSSPVPCQECYYRVPVVTDGQTAGITLRNALLYTGARMLVQTFGKQHFYNTTFLWSSNSALALIYVFLQDGGIFFISTQLIHDGSSWFPFLSFLAPALQQQVCGAAALHSPLPLPMQFW